LGTHRRTGHIQPTLRTGDAHVCQTTLLGQLAGVLHGTLVRERTLFHTRKKHIRIFQTFGRMQGHHRDLAGILALSRQLIRVGDQCRGLQKTGQRGIRRVLFEFGGHGLQLGKIVHTRSILRILGTLQFLQKTAFIQYFGHHFGWFRIMFLGEIGQLVHQITECAQRFGGTACHAFNLVHMFNGFEEREAMRVRVAGHQSLRACAESSFRHIEDTPHVHIIRGIHDGLQIRDGVLDFPTFIEFGAADQLIRQIGVDHGLFQRT